MLPQLHLVRNSLRAAHELPGWLFRALHTGAGPGVVSTGTRPPQLGASRARGRTDSLVLHTVRTTTTTSTTTTTTSVAIFGSSDIYGYPFAAKVALVLYCLEQAYSFTRVVFGLWSTGENNGEATVFVSERRLSQCW